MSGVNIEFPRQAFEPFLRRLARFGNEDFREILYDLGPHLFRSHQKRHKQGRAPDGAPWAPLTGKYLKRKQRVRPGIGIGFFDRHMLGDQFSYQVRGDRLRIGTAAVYGAAFHFGRPDKNQPARPSVGFSSEDVADILEVIGEHLERLESR